MFVTFFDQSWLLGCPVPHTFGSGALASALNTRGLDFLYFFVKKAIMFLTNGFSRARLYFSGLGDGKLRADIGLHTV